VSDGREDVNVRWNTVEISTKELVYSESLALRNVPTLRYTRQRNVNIIVYVLIG
jgi:hypothetical protein